MKEGNAPERQKKAYKFKELKVYASTEWLADNKKKYRQVFERDDISYIYVELSFYNKLFDQEAWDIDIELKCYELKKNKRELCNLNFKKKVSKYDNIVYFREGWGNKKIGVFWKRGTYFWEAWIDGEKVATKYFYVEDVAEHNILGFNPFANLQKVQLYEGQFDDVLEDERTYLNVFSAAETRYVYAELTFENIYFKHDWHLELFVKFYNSSRELKGQVSRLQAVKKDEHTFQITAGWGSNAKGSWSPGEYTIEIVLMDYPLATIFLDISNRAEPGSAVVELPNKTEFIGTDQDEYFGKTFEEVFVDLDDLVGLDEVKIRVKEHAQYIQFLNLRKDKGFIENNDVNIHSVFTGNPGTGKTTVAKMMGILYKKMGLLSKGHVHEVDRVDLVGEYIGQTAPKVKAAIEKARGGVLFIDEAYSLSRANDDSKDFGKEVIEILVKEMSNGVKDFAVIVAGYPKEMKHFVESNPGLKSRFKHFFEFRDYLPQELIEIAEYAAKDKEVQLNEESHSLLEEIITNAYRNRDRTFGNARFVHDLIEKAKFNMGLRIMSRKNPSKANQTDLSTILVRDVKSLEKSMVKNLPSIPIDQKLLKHSLEELEQLIGIENIKKEIHNLVNVVKYYREQNKDVLKRFYLHTVFVGNPGTGKTTVARILTKIYKALGILERGHMVETDRQGLVAGYVGQTAIKTNEKIEESMGGVLFIDEAYSLTTGGGSQGDFGGEAIQTILKQMEDRRGEFFVFAAGYPDNMEKFLKANPGLSSRFDKILRFEDYQENQLFEIALSMIKEESYKLNKESKEVLFSKLHQLYLARDKYFGNARSVRKIISQVIQNQNLRMASIDDNTDVKHRMLIEAQDINLTVFDQEKEVFNRKGIGFNT